MNDKLDQFDSAFALGKQRSAARVEKRAARIALSPEADAARRLAGLTEKWIRQTGAQPESRAMTVKAANEFSQSARREWPNAPQSRIEATLQALVQEVVTAETEKPALGLYKAVKLRTIFWVTYLRSNRKPL